MTNASRSESRDGYIVRVAAIHTTEGGGTAAALRDADWWAGSAHAIFGDGPDSDPDDFTKGDADEVTPLNGGVPYSKASWTLRSGNRWSVNAELIGYASWDRATWLKRWRQLNRVALWLAEMHKRFDIPLQKITAQQYRAGAHGVIGHVDHTVGYKDGTHWDPGPGFPYDVVIAKAKQYLAAELEPNLTPAQAKQLDDIHHFLLEQKLDRTGVDAKDTVQVAEVGSLLRYADGNALKARRGVDALLELVAETLQATHQVLDALTAAPAKPAATTKK